MKTDFQEGKLIRILIVDDEPEIRDIFAQFLQKEGYHFQSAPDGTTALELFRSFEPHIVMLDVLMPDINGIDVLKGIREIDKEAKVIMVSGMHDLGIAREAITFGAIDYVTKPIDFRFLRSLLEKETRGILGGKTLAN